MTKKSSDDTGQKSPGAAKKKVSRRQLLPRLVSVPVVGGLVLSALKNCGWASHEEKQLGTRLKRTIRKPVDAVTRPSKKFEWTRMEALKEKVPSAQIGDVKLSRVILGGNLIGGWAHARDLIYVSKLVKAYHHREKVFETLRLAEACGINAILTHPMLCGVVNDYWKNGGGEIQFISDCGGDDLIEAIKKSIDAGACACYIQGAVTEKLVAQGKFDTIEKALELIRRSQLPAGIGAHELQAIATCVEKGFEPDFWMKTLHHTNYWSAKVEPEKDNIWCRDPKETIAFMKELKQPWIAFKVLGAGAIEPTVGFKYAFENGADFICVGMYDFQVVDDANIAVSVLKSKERLNRQRPWIA